MDELIRDMAFIERPRERLTKVGAAGLANDELLANVIRTGVKGKSCVTVAREILAKHTLNDLLQMPMARLSAIPCLGASRAAVLLSMAELVHRAGKVSDGLPTIQSVNDVAAQAVELRDKKKEYLLAFFLNARHQLITKEVISIGTLTASLAHPREIFAPAIGKAAAGVILVHNHPSGDPSPSEEDVRLTQRIRQAGQIMGIELLDHLIIAENGSYSFKTAGRL